MTKTRYYYDMENRLVAASGAKGANLRYDPLGRLYEVNGPFGLTRFIYDGDHVAAEYNSAGTVLRRYMWGPGADEPILWDEGSAVNCSGGKFLHPDRQGSVVAAADCAGALIGINKYDEYGIPQSGNTGRFQYTGQAWLPELGMYYYKARIYSPTLGRFLQTDPIGYGDGLNWYAYVGSDPVNATDPSGTDACIDETGSEIICVIGKIDFHCEPGSYPTISDGSVSCQPYPGPRNRSPPPETLMLAIGSLGTLPQSGPSPFCQQILADLNKADEGLSSVSGNLTDAAAGLAVAGLVTNGLTEPLAVGAEAGALFTGGATVPITFTKGIVTGDYRQFGMRLVTLGIDRGLGHSKILKRIPIVGPAIGRALDKINQIAPTPTCPSGR